MLVRCKGLIWSLYDFLYFGIDFKLLKTRNIQNQNSAAKNTPQPIFDLAQNIF
jgi:hypothetical protein